MKKTLSILLLLIFLSAYPLPANAYIAPDYLSDYFVKYQKYLNEIRIGYTWDSTKGSPNVVVAVIDDGVYLNHPDLKDNIWYNKKEINGNSTDDDGNGYSDDYYGWNFINNSPEMTVKGKHGTMVAGIIGARGDNNIGIAGIAWNVKLMSLIACNSTGCPEDAIKNAIRYAANNGVDVINLSLGRNGTYSYLHEPFNEVINYAYQKGVVIVAAAGNGDVEGGFGKDLGKFPVSPVCNETGDQIIGVSATAEGEEYLTSWSNYGGCAQISAPGENIITTAPPNYSNFDVEYDIGDGTSFSAPIISGVAALIRSYNRLISNVEVIKTINAAGKPGYSQKIDTRAIFDSLNRSVDLLSVNPSIAKPGDELIVQSSNFNSGRTVKLIGPSMVTLTNKDVIYVSGDIFQIKVPTTNLKAGKYTIDVDGVKLHDAFQLSQSAPQSQQPLITVDNILGLQAGWLIKNIEFVEVFSVDENFCLHWIINEKAAERFYGPTWNHYGVIKKFDSIPRGYKFCEKIE